jgi:dienelactone hydrolase
MKSLSRTDGIGLGLGLGLLLSSWTHARGADVPTPKAPEYPHKTIRIQEFGVGGRSYYLFEPARPRPAIAPVVVFLHGWYAYNPAAYGAWIEHLVQGGRVVIFPRYQANSLTLPGDYLDNAMSAIRDALDVLAASPEHVRPDRHRFALIGHSMGANMSAQMAAVAGENGLPAPRAVVCLMPGEILPSRVPSLARIPSTTLLVVAAGEDDRIVGDSRAREIFAEASAIPPARKKFILYRTDLHGGVIADHFAPTAAHHQHRYNDGEGMLLGLQFSRARVDAFDLGGFWRMADITLEAGFQGRTLDEASDRGALFRNLGYWSDGREVFPPIVGHDLSTIPRVFPTNGLRLIRWVPKDLLPGGPE